MIPLHKVPRGLLELLRARTLGRSPDELANAVIANVDATEMYGSDLCVVASDSGGAGSINRTVTGTSANMGRLLGMSGQVTIGAAAGTQVRLLLQYSPGPQFSAVIVADRVITAPVAAAVYAVSVQFPRALVFNPGATFTFTTSGDAAGADHTPVRRDLFENYAV
jgi:hypothetical protein